MKPEVNLLIAPPNVGKTRYLLKKLREEPTHVVLPNEEHEEFKTEFRTLLHPTTTTYVSSESDIDADLKNVSTQNVIFLYVTTWDDNQANHMNAFISLARFAISKKQNVWAAIDAGSAEELALLQAAVLKIAERCPSAIFEEVELEMGLGLLFRFNAAKV